MFPVRCVFAVALLLLQACSSSGSLSDSADAYEVADSGDISQRVETQDWDSGPDPPAVPDVSDVAFDVAPELSEPACLVPEAGMGITQDVILCPGTYVLPDLAGDGALVVAGDNLTVTCLGTVLSSGVTPLLEDPLKTRGISVVGRTGVHVTGCTVNGYHYGLYVEDSVEISLTVNDLSGNFHAPTLSWAFETVSGGGARLVRVSSAYIVNNTMKHNFNGLELRSCQQVEARNNDASHASNAGALLVASHECLLADNDFSWAVRGKGVWFDERWYGWDTADSAAVIMDAGCSYSVVSGNNLSHSGRGIYVRSILGACPERNVFQDNDASFAAHAAVECWCDRNTFESNTASDALFGFLLSGADDTVLSKNQASRNRLDGISVQSGECRHSIISDNLLEDNGRAGLLLTGRSFPDDTPLDAAYPGLSNVGHIIAQANRFSGNKATDIHLSGVLGIHLLSNCTLSGTEPTVDQGEDARDIFVEGSCADLDNPSEVEAVLTLTGGQTDVPLVLDASQSSTSQGSELDHYWLVQAFADLFPGDEPVEPFLSASGSAVASAEIPVPGIYSAAVTVHDSVRGALAFGAAYVAPAGDELAELNAGAWSNGCGGGTETTQVDDFEFAVVGQSALRTKTGCPYSFWIEFPQKEGGWALTPESTLHMFVRTDNPNPNGWQGQFPLLQFRDSAEKKRFVNPTWNMLATSQEKWIYVTVPVGGGPGWKLDDKGANLEDIQRIFFQMDTHDWGAYTVWVDGVVLVP